MNVAVVNSGDPKNALAAVEGLSKRIGFSVDIGAWMEAGTKPLAGLGQFKNRVFAANLRDRNTLGAKGHNVTLGTGAANLTPFLLELSRLQPPSRPVDYPLPPGKDAGGQRSEVKPLFFTLNPAGATDRGADLSHAVAAYDAALPAAIRYRVDELPG
jgi:hypothetical protein